MVCDSCWDHLAFRRPDLVRQFQKLKRDGIVEAVNGNATAEGVERLLQDQRRYVEAFPARHDQLVPGPWCANADIRPVIPGRRSLAVWTSEEPRSWASVRDNVRPGGCHLCHVLVGMVEYALGADVPEMTSLTSELIVQEVTMVPSMIKVQVYSTPACLAEDLSATLWLYCKLNGIPAVDLQSHLPLHPLQRQDLTDIAGFLKRNLQECMRSHNECRAGQTRGWLPTRLMEVDHLNRKLYLVEGRDIEISWGGGRPPYATLSHVWGSAIETRALTLTSLTYEEYKGRGSGLSFGALPAAWKEALITIGGLDPPIRYVWIDSLCIIQDSAEDWHRECMAMEDIYKEAICNVAICDGHDAGPSQISSGAVREDQSDEGPVNGSPVNGNHVNGDDVNGNRINGNRINGNHTNGNYTNGHHLNGNRLNGDAQHPQNNRAADPPPPLPQHAQRIEMKRYFTQGDVAFDILPDWVRLTRDHSMLYKRGWALQETLLSTRLLNFTAKIPSYECKRHLVTQAYCQGTGINPAFDECLGSERGWLPTEPQGRDFVFRRWLKMVEKYSGKEISEGDDKLIAVGGLAKSFLPLLGESYNAGHWGGRLLIPSLLWAAEGTRDALPPSVYRAPSWSWASVDSPVRMMHKATRINQLLVQDASLATVPKAGDPFGQVSAGRLKLKGYLFEIEDLHARLGQLKSADQCRLDRTEEVYPGDAAYFLPLIQLVDNGGYSTFHGLFVQELGPALYEGVLEGVRRFQRVGMGSISDERELGADGSTDCNILDDDAWAGLVLMSDSGSTVGMQSMVIV